MFRAILPAVVVFALAACSGSEPNATGSTQDATPAPKPGLLPPEQRQHTVLDDQMKAIDKARAVQGVIDKQKAAADKALQDAGG